MFSVPLKRKGFELEAQTRKREMENLTFTNQSMLPTLNVPQVLYVNLSAI